MRRGVGLFARNGPLGENGGGQRRRTSACLGDQGAHGKDGVITPLAAADQHWWKRFFLGNEEVHGRGAGGLARPRGLTSVCRQPPGRGGSH